MLNILLVKMNHLLFLLITGCTIQENKTCNVCEFLTQECSRKIIEKGFEEDCLC